MEQAKYDPTNLPKEAFEPLSRETEAEREKIAAPSLNFFEDSWRRLKKNKGAVISLFILLVFAILSVGSIWFSPQDPAKQDPQYAKLPPKIPGVSIPGLDGTVGSVSGERVDKYKAANVPKGKYYLLGTDAFGRDLLSRLLMGTRMSLIIAFVAALLDLTIGVAYGLLSGMAGGWVDTVMQRILEVLSGIPNLVVMILMLTIFEPGMLSIILAMILTGWITMARIVRAQTLKIRDQEFVLAAETLGESKVKIALKHILPNIASVIIVQMMFTIPSAIFFEAFLSFIGLGLSAPKASLGTLLSDGYKSFPYLLYLMVIPAVTLSIIMICFNLLADGLRDAFDPKTKD